MKKNLTLMLLASLLPFYLFSQVVTSFENHYSADFQTQDFLFEAGGDFMLIANPASLARTDSVGMIRWTKSYTHPDVVETVRILPTAAGGYIILGDNGGLNATQLFLMETDSVGDPIWMKTFSAGMGVDLLATSDGGYLIMGFKYLDNIPYSVIKTDLNGNLLWSLTYANPDGEFFPADLCESSMGEYIVATTARNTSSFNQISLLKLSSTGTVLQSRISTNTDNYTVRSLVPLANGGFMMQGDAIIPFDDGYIIGELSPLLDFVWLKHYSKQQDHQGVYMEQGANGNFQMLGYEGNLGGARPTLLEFDANGTIQYARRFGGSSNDRPLIMHTNGNLDIGFVGETTSFQPSGTKGHFAKFNLPSETTCWGFGTTYDVVNLNTTMASRTMTFGSFVTSSTASLPTATNITQVGSVVCSSSSVNVLDPVPDLEVWPNPSSGRFNLRFSATEAHYRISVVDLLGRTVLSRSLHLSPGQLVQEEIELGPRFGIGLLTIEANGRKTVRRIQGL